MTLTPGTILKTFPGKLVLGGSSDPASALRAEFFLFEMIILLLILKMVIYWWHELKAI